MKLNIRNLMLLALIVLMSAATVSAQTTASLTGTVTTDGAPLPGVTVTISSPNMQGTRTTTTGDAGGFNFAGIPAGEYAVQFELAGMSNATRRVQVGPGQTGRADADLRVSAVTESITVTAAAPSVLETPTVSQNISQELVEELPIARTVNAAALLAPGVTGNTFSNNQFSISGSPGYDNLVMINGVVITEAVRSQTLPLYIEDAVQETTIMTGGVSAEYGRFTGGVVNSITKSGGNEFSGSLRDSFTNPTWSEENPVQITNNTQNTDVLGQVWEATLGGFVLRDRLWFFLAGRDTESDSPVSTRPVPGSTTSLSSSSVTTETRYEVKLTGQVTSKHSLMGSYFKSDQTATNTQFTTLSYDLASLTDRTDPRELRTARYNGILTNNFMVEAQYNAMKWGVGHGSGSKFTDLIKGTIVRNLSDSNARWNSPTFCGVCDKETRSNDSQLLKANYFLSSQNLGNHNFVAGGERFSEHRFANNYQSGSNFRVFVNGASLLANGDIAPVVNPGPTPGGVTSGSTAFFVHTSIAQLQANESDLRTDSFFVNDRWDLNEHFTFNVGLRYDRNNAIDSSGNAVSDDSKFSPRLSATYDIFGNGRHRVTASFSDYASRIVEGPATGQASAGAPAYIYYAYNGPAINPTGTPADQLVNTHAALQIMFDWLNAQCNAQGQCGVNNPANVAALSHSIPGYSTVIGEQLASPYVREVTLGYGTQLFSNAFLRFDLVARNWDDFYASRIDASTPRVTNPFGKQNDVAVVENTSDITREYRGLQFQAAWRPRRFNLGLNYTYSTLEGNDEQENATSGVIGNNPSAMYYPELRNFERNMPQGYLASDQRHKARAWVGYDVPMPEFIGRLNVSVLQSFDSGTPYSAVGNINISSFRPFDAATGKWGGLLEGVNPAYASPTGSVQYFFSDRGEFRLDDVSSTDVALNYSFPISRFEIFAQGEALNVFNRQTATVVNTTVTQVAAFNPFTTQPIECTQALAGTPGRPTNAQCVAAGAHWIKGANFGKPTAATASIPANAFTSNFQTARTYRFSVGFRF
jgi:outer membrane receptor protein involved in Fe transport